MSTENKHKYEIVFYLIHGYTGGPSDFGELPSYLESHLDAKVYTPLLPGHGTKVEDLANITYDDFRQFVLDDFDAVTKNAKFVVVGGVSFGAQLALYLAATRNVYGVFNVCTPHWFRFPFNLPGLQFFGIFKKTWNKRYHESEMPLRKKATYYNKMHSNGLKVSKAANKMLDNILYKIEAPILTIHSTGDRIGRADSAHDLAKKVSSKKRKTIIKIDRHHNVFYSPSRYSVYDGIIHFFTNGKGKIYRK